MRTPECHGRPMVRVREDRWECGSCMNYVDRRATVIVKAWAAAGMVR